MRAPHEVLGITPNATKEEALEACRRKEIYMNPMNFEEGSEQRRHAEANVDELLEALDAFTDQAAPPETVPIVGNGEKQNRSWLFPVLSNTLGCLAYCVFCLLFCFLFYGELSWFILALLFSLAISVRVMEYSLRRGNTLADIIWVVLLGVGGSILCSIPFGMFVAGFSLCILNNNTIRNPYKASNVARVCVSLFARISFALILVSLISAVYLNFIR